MIELNGELTCEKGEDGSWRDGTALDADICLYVQYKYYKLYFGSACICAAGLLYFTFKF